MAKITDSTLSHLMARSQQGDKQAYTQLLTSLQSILQEYLYKRIFDPSSVDDVLQNILIAVDKAKATYTPSKPFYPWLYAIAQYKVIDYIRQQERKIAKETEFEPISETFCAPETNKETEEAFELIHLALEKLPEKKRNIVTLLKIEGYSIEEVAEKTGISIANVKVTAHRAYKDMRLTIEKLDKKYD